jgi:proteasome lid subunit RPN8/RPN11
MSDLPSERFPGGDVTPRDGEFRVAVDKKVYAEILAHAKEDPEVELGGILVGRAKRDQHGPFLHILGAVRAEKAEQQGAQIKFTHETLARAWTEIDKRYPGMNFVGWYHTHPGFDVFLSDYDKFIHNSFFTGDHQVAYVYDPLQGTEGFFRKQGEEIVQLERFWLGAKQIKTARPENRAKAAGTDLTSVHDAIRRLEEVLADRGGGMTNYAIWGLVVVLLGFLIFQIAKPEARRVFIPQEDPKTGLWYYAERRPDDPPDKLPERPRVILVPQTDPATGRTYYIQIHRGEALPKDPGRLTLVPRRDPVTGQTVYVELRPGDPTPAGPEPIILAPRVDPESKRTYYVQVRPGDPIDAPAVTEPPRRIPVPGPADLPPFEEPK